MTKDILISICGLQFETSAEDINEQMELIVAGQYYDKNGTRYLVYDEQTEGIADRIRTMIKVNDDRVEISKTGGMAATMIFEEGRKNLSTYRTPYGNLMVGIDTTEIRMEEDEDSLSIEVFYHLDLNYEFFANARVKIRACSKEAGATMFRRTGA
ncbi:MAG: DUF1934 domain-containing protein [Lachnospiraceae bacterium]|nr:DUF1934 domain-containing protein [Lachnospiraceae bacterium]